MSRPDYDPSQEEITKLRLLLNQAESQRDAFKAALHSEVKDIMRRAVYQANYDARYDAEASLKEYDEAENTIAQLKAKLENRDREVAALKSEVERLKGIILAQSSDFVRSKTADDGIKTDGHNDLAGRAVERCLELQAEVQRLRNLGCDIANEFVRTEFTSSCSYGDPPCEPPPDFCDYPLSVQIWFNHINAAKEGKPSV